MFLTLIDRTVLRTDCIFNGKVKLKGGKTKTVTFETSFVEVYNV